jgi:tRNA threonylcarbamoyl adenosine modification protein (Sua5/YciO/YrdC/YwlC family)
VTDLPEATDGLLERAVRAAEAGELIVIPTDTVYGIGTRPDRPEATHRLFRAKGRPPNLELPVLVPSLPAALRIARFDDRARRLVQRFWPGPLTVVLQRTAASARWPLGGEAATVGVRMPRHLLALAVLERTGPLAVTSANLSGRPTPATCDGLVETFGDEVAVYLCQEEPLAGAPSTVVDLSREGVRVLRSGGIDEGDVLQALG